MPLESLNHVTLLTANHQKLKDFYKNVLGLEVGWRPPFSSTGTWLYCGDVPQVHLVEISNTPQVKDIRMEHMAFSASGMQEFLDHFRENNIPYQITLVPEVGIRQVNVFDPDDNHVEIQFGPDEEVELKSFKPEEIRHLVLKGSPGHLI